MSLCAVVVSTLKYFHQLIKMATGSKRGFIKKSVPIDNPSLTKAFFDKPEIEIRQALDDDVKQFGEASAMALMSKSNLAMSLMEKDPEVGSCFLSI